MMQQVYTKAASLVGMLALLSSLSANKVFAANCIEPPTDTPIYIRSKATGLYLSHWKQNLALNSPVSQYYKSEPPDSWKLLPADNHSYHIVNVYFMQPNPYDSGGERCLVVDDIHEGSVVRLHSCDVDYPKFYFQCSENYDNFWYVVSYRSGLMVTPDNQTPDQTNVHQQVKDYEQVWTIETPGQ